MRQIVIVLALITIQLAHAPNCHIAIVRQMSLKTYNSRLSPKLENFSYN